MRALRMALALPGPTRSLARVPRLVEFASPLRARVPAFAQAPVRDLASKRYEDATAEEKKDFKRVIEWLDEFNPDSIPRDKFRVQFARSSGPGGQHVNKVNSKAEIRFHLASATWMPEYSRKKMADVFHHRINEEGEFIIACDETRSQSQNLELCFKRLFRMVVEVSEVPREPSAEKREKIARQSAAANEKRLRDKQQQARKKRLRQASES